MAIPARLLSAPMIVLDGAPLTPGAALDPLDPASKPPADRATPLVSAPHPAPLSHASSPPAASPASPPPCTLRLVTYGYERGRPDDAPALAFDIRDLPNPPKAVREAHLGTSEVMQACFFADAGVRARFAEVLRAVLGAAGRGVQAGRTLLVAVCCRKGKHRSVAFVERLARELRTALAPDAWRVEVAHRDVHLPKSRPGTAGAPHVPDGGRSASAGAASAGTCAASASTSVAPSVVELSEANGETNGVAGLGAGKPLVLDANEDSCPRTNGISGPDGWRRGG